MICQGTLCRTAEKEIIRGMQTGLLFQIYDKAGL